MYRKGRECIVNGSYPYIHHGTLCFFFLTHWNVTKEEGRTSGEEMKIEEMSKRVSGDREYEETENEERENEERVRENEGEGS